MQADAYTHAELAGWLPQPSGGHQLCSAAGPTTHFVAYDRSNTNSHFGILSRSISLTEDTFKKERPLGGSHSSRPPLFSPSFLLGLGTDLAVHTHLLKRPVIAHSLEPSGWEAFRRYFLTHPVPESHSAAGRLQPFVTLPVRAWCWLTGDGCVKLASGPIQKKKGEGKRGGGGGGC